MKKKEPSYSCKLEADGCISVMYKNDELLWELCVEKETNHVGIYRFDEKKFIPATYEGKEITKEEFDKLRQKRYDENVKEYMNKRTLPIKNYQELEYIPICIRKEDYIMEKNCGNCRYKVERDMPLYKECVSCKGMKHFEPKYQTNRQWLESLSDEEYAINIYQICIKFLQIFLEKSADNEDCTIEQLIMDWLQAEHRSKEI